MKQSRSDILNEKYGLKVSPEMKQALNELFGNGSLQFSMPLKPGLQPPGQPPPAKPAQPAPQPESPPDYQI